MTSNALSLILEGARIHGTLLAHKSFRAPWGLSLPERPVARFHLVAQGRCWLRLSSGELLGLEQGDLVLLCRPGAHQLLGTPDGQAIDVETLSSNAWEPSPKTDLVNSGDAFLVCGEFAWWSDRFPPVFDALPPLLRLPGQQGRPVPVVAGLFDLLAEEGKVEFPGRSLVVDRLLEVLLVLVLRQTLADGVPGLASWISALADPVVSRALAALHQNPERAWTLESLAKVSLRSRAAFSRQFTLRLGMSPMRYLAWWRMQRAKVLLRDQILSLDQVAQHCGYGSAFSFSKAFRQAFGMSPGRFRSGKGPLESFQTRSGAVTSPTKPLELNRNELGNK